MNTAKTDLTAELRARAQQFADLILGLVTASSTLERRMVVERAVRLKCESLLLVCDLHRVTASLTGMSRHLNLTETEYLVAVGQVDGPNAALHGPADVRVAVETERLAYIHAIGARQ